jgi:hypothetical protein
MWNECESSDQGWVITVHPFGVLRLRVHRPAEGSDRTPRPAAPPAESGHGAARHETDPISIHPTTVPAA